MDNFHSTVLQRPRGSDREEDERDRERHHHRRDILNSPTAPPPPRHSSFTLRSPTQSDFHHPPPAYTSPGPATAAAAGPTASTSTTTSSAHHTSPRQILHSPYKRSPYQESAPPPVAPPPTLPPSSASSNAASALSPLQAPAGYAPPGGELHPARESKPAATSSYYDPTTDTRSERRISDAGAWPTAAGSKGRDHYHYPPASSSHAEQQSHASYYNGGGSRPSYSPVAASFPPQSPRSHTSTTTTTAAAARPSTPPQQSGQSGKMLTNGSSYRVLGSDGGSPSRANPAGSTPNRTAAELMSFSNILTSGSETVSKPATPVPAKADEPEPRRATPTEPSREPDADMKEPEPEQEEPTAEASADIETEPERHVSKDAAPAPTPTDAEPDRERKKEKTARKLAKPRISASRESRKESTKGAARRSSGLKESSPRLQVVGTKRHVNGQVKAKSDANEHKILAILAQMDSDPQQFVPTDDEAPSHEDYLERAAKRQRLLVRNDAKQNTRRRADFAVRLGRKLSQHAELGKRRYDDRNYDAALQDVRDQEIFAEKERKKDMQRKRRREKSMAATMEQKEAALARARAAADETERQKHLRDAERMSKKAQQTKKILDSGVKGPVRNIDLSPDGASAAANQGSDAEPAPKKAKGRSGPRPKKSKEQKQAEKDDAEAAQAALDAGEELPSKEETQKPRIIKIKKNRDDGSKDKENREPKEDKEKEKADEAAANDARYQTKGYKQIYDQIWRDMARKDVSKTYRLASDSFQTKGSNLKKTAILASKEAKRWQLRTNKGTKDQQARAKRVMRDMMGFWKRNEREERDLRKAAERQHLENQRKEEAEMEAARQKRKLNFLLQQTELFSHFIGNKIKTQEVERSTDNPDVAATSEEQQAPKPVVEEAADGPIGDKVTDFSQIDFDAEDESQRTAAAMANAQNAIAEAKAKARQFNDDDLNMDESFKETGKETVDIEQPKLINAQLKEYQLKGLSWLVNLYEQGINGILADEMGLGKTVQSISVMAYLAEKHNIWGPFLVVAPASTLHNWEQEIRKFVPEFKGLPYWGSQGDRKVLRKFWDRKQTRYSKDAAFHVCITSYQMVVSDVAYFQKMKWQYMILDEAQAIKSSSSSRWKSLLGFQCRNRLLLTGTPIQNNMQELWALLHFIMPSLFDSHDEFSEWFSKDIESHAQSNTKLNEDQLKRLHMILKPFMLRRIKKHVQKELGDKIELDIFCDLTYRQRAYYANLRDQISIMDLIEKATTGDDNDSGTLMNLVMQFRKVCNHPDLFQRAEVTSALSCAHFAETASFLREGSNVLVGYSTRSLVEYELPKLVWRDGGRLHRAGPDNDRAGWRNRALGHMMNIYAPENVARSTSGSDAFAFLRFVDYSAGEVYRASQQDVFARAAGEARRKNRLRQVQIAYDDAEDQGYTPPHALLHVRERHDRMGLAGVTEKGILGRLMNVAREAYDDSELGRLEPAARANATAPPIEVVCSGRGTAFEREDTMFNRDMRRVLSLPSVAEEKALVRQKVPLGLWPRTGMFPAPDNEKKKFTNITVPSMRRFVTDSGKLAKLDELLFKLKSEGHRVLLYFQMTRMIDLMEEYLTYRNYKYCRLDGSTKLEDRRDTVSDFQTRPEIFIFLLSTRAGGLGINLTSADTVIFYDSDWNPTIDSQAMDRAHRLGQTRQVTVYRLITRGTIEERIRKRALQKEEVQRVVIQGGGASVDFSGRRAPENRNRDIAMWLADDEQAEMIERREKELLESGEYDKAQKKKGGKRKRTGAEAGAGVSLDEMYHEGEGNFDDKNSGTATPIGEGEAKGLKKRRLGPAGKKAKSAKQRLAIADGSTDM